MLKTEDSKEELVVESSEDEPSLFSNDRNGRSKRDRQLENAYAPDEHSLDQMAN
jgi:hypothetical protein